MADTDILIDTALVDPKQHLLPVDGARKLVQTLHLSLAADKPSCRPIHGILNIIPVRHTGRTLVKCHSNRGRQIRLNPHTLLRTHEYLTPVDMGMKIHALFLDPS